MTMRTMSESARPVACLRPWCVSTLVQSLGHVPPKLLAGVHLLCLHCSHGADSLLVWLTALIEWPSAAGAQVMSSVQLWRI